MLRAVLEAHDVEVNRPDKVHLMDKVNVSASDDKLCVFRALYQVGIPADL